MQDISSNISTITLGTSLAIQWLRLRASTEGGTGLIPGWGTKIPHAMRAVWPKQTNKQQTNKNLP